MTLTGLLRLLLIRPSGDQVLLMSRNDPAFCGFDETCFSAEQARSGRTLQTVNWLCYVLDNMEVTEGDSIVMREFNNYQIPLSGIQNLWPL